MGGTSADIGGRGNGAQPLLAEPGTGDSFYKGSDEYVDICVDTEHELPKGGAILAQSKCKPRFTEMNNCEGSVGSRPALTLESADFPRFHTRELPFGSVLATEMGSPGAFKLLLKKGV